jgi:hypothetical protein
MTARCGAGLQPCERRVTVQVAVEHRRAAERTVRHQRIAGDITHAHPAQARVQARGVAVGDGVEHQQGLAALARRRFRGAYQRCPQTLAPDAAMHQHLREIGAVRLVLR